MAWIKMRSELLTHPKIVRILSAMRPHDVQTKTDKFRVIGGLHAVWCIFDQHSEDGVLVGYTPELMDHMIGWEGFSQAMVSVDWLQFDGSQTLILPEFDEHNSQSAKRRAEDQKRKEGGRKKDKCPQSVRNLSASIPDEQPTESGLEKEKEKETTYTPTRAGEISRLMRQYTISATPAHPTVIAIAEQDVALETIEAACKEAREKKPNESISAAYIAKKLEGWKQSAAGIDVSGAKVRAINPPDDWFKSQQGIERKGRELGMAARGSESYDSFRERIREELKKRERGAAA